MIDYMLLQRLCQANGISGDEAHVRKLISEEISACADSVVTDPLGNLLVHKKGRNRPKVKLMLSAHMDEVGLMVTDITAEGYLKFDEVGGIDRRVLIGKHVVVNHTVNGVIGIKPIHLTKGDESSAIPAYSELYIDIGAQSAQEARQVVSPGDSVCFVSAFTQTATAIRSKAIDDRFGCMVLIDLIKSDLEYDMDFAFVVQEEVGLHGATTAAYTLDPDFALVIETTTAADIPEIDAAKQVCCLGEGAVISMMDRRTIYDREMAVLALKTAEAIGVKAQVKRAVAGGNDAGVIHQSRGGVRTLAISLPCRYLHAPNCVADKNDCESVRQLTHALASLIARGTLHHDYLS